MTDKLDKENLYVGGDLPFPAEWIKTQPRKVEDVLSGLSVEEQVRCILGRDPHMQQQLLMLSEKAVEVTQSFPVEEVYNLINEVGKESNACLGWNLSLCHHSTSKMYCSWSADTMDIIKRESSFPTSLIKL